MSAGSACHIRGMCSQDCEVLAVRLLLLGAPLSLDSCRVTHVAEDAGICCSHGLNSSPYTCTLTLNL